ncbi:MAG: undecaprenyl/decaprenyl-phosphate alpha-N-acetylglucosaminyl 1-phosphate transferase [Bacteroidetes bacterium SW_8_64_56]|nr:MAG: undecaprenyl/decaprenyl-phosphate alpha-N-acetylglucosaminyl 1-phosphate transferase [Bacteroidetes bacterium SW_8_64_56]
MLSKILSPALVPWVSGGLAFLVAVGLTPIVRWGARRGGWVAIPEDEKWHDTPTTILGGIAIFLGGTVALIVSGGVSAFPAPVWGGAVLLIGTGLIDDLWGLGPVAKLTAQLGSAALVLSAGFLLAPGAPIWVAAPLTLVWLLGLPNAVNLLDAMDGVAASVTALAAGFLGLVAGLQGLGALATAAAVLAGATAGFLVYNIAPASIFMGDCGSLLLGYVLAVLGLGVQETGGTARSVLVPVVILAVPLFDTAFVSITRSLRGQSVTNGGTDHTMHRLVRLGWSERQVPLLLCGGGLLGGGIGLLGQVGPDPLFYVLALGGMGTAVGVGILLAQRTAPEAAAPPDPESVETTRPASARSRSVDPEIESEERVPRGPTT